MPISVPAGSCLGSSGPEIGAVKLRSALKHWAYEAIPGLRGSFPYYGTRVYFPERSLIFQLACEQGVYEHENLKLLLSLVRPDGWYFDVGANIGLLSVPVLASAAGCRVLSVEPSPATFRCLARTRELSSFRDRWRVLDAVAGNTVGETDLYVFPGGLGAFDGTRDTARGGDARTIRVPMTTLDTVWEGLGRPPVSVIKIDVEGGELGVLEGAACCIRERRPPILLEITAVNVHAHGLEPEIFLDYAAHNGYSLFAAPGLIPVTTPGGLGAQLLRTENFLLYPEPLSNTVGQAFPGTAS